MLGHRRVPTFLGVHGRAQPITILPPPEFSKSCAPDPDLLCGGKGSEPLCSGPIDRVDPLLVTCASESFAMRSQSVSVRPQMCEARESRCAPLLLECYLGSPPRGIPSRHCRWTGTLVRHRAFPLQVTTDRTVREERRQVRTRTLNEDWRGSLTRSERKSASWSAPPRPAQGAQRVVRR